MKVFVLGGYGKVGKEAIKLLVQSDLVSDLAIAGRNAGRAEQLAAEIGEKVIAIRSDGTDEKQLAAQLEGYDVVINGASNEAVLPSILAASRSGTHYCDASWGGVVDEARELSSKIEAAGVVAVLANGVSPCVSNLMGVHAAQQLDEVEQLQLGRSDIMNFRTGKEMTPQQWLEDPEQSFAELANYKGYIGMAFHGLQDNGVQAVRTYQNGGWEDQDPIRNGVHVPLFKGGKVLSYPYYSGDPRLPFGYMPHDLSRASSVDMWFSPFPPRLHELLRTHARQVIDGGIDADAAVSSLYHALECDPRLWQQLPEEFTQKPKMWVCAEGRKNGRAARYRCWLTAPMWNVGGYLLTSVALVATTNLILREEVRMRGVLHAEKAFAPLSYFDEVASVLSELLPGRQLINNSLEWLE